MSRSSAGGSRRGATTRCMTSISRGRSVRAGQDERLTRDGNLDEVLGFRPDFIEHQLAHAVRDPNGRAYNRTAFLPERRHMMQEWADYLDRLGAGEG